MAESWASAPPPVTRGRRWTKFDWDWITEQLKANPGVWMEIPGQPNLGTVGFIKKKRAVALQDPDWIFEAVSRNNNRETGTCEVWMSATPVKKGK